MRFLFFCFAVLSAATVWGQTGSDGARKYSVGFSVSPDYNVRVPIYFGREYDLPNDVFSQVDIPQIGLTTGVNGVYRLNKTVDLQTGLWYTLRRYKFKEQTHLVLECDFTNSCPDNIPRRSQINHVHHLVGIPLKANFNFGQKRLCWTLGAGATGNVLVGSTTKARVVYEDGSQGTQIGHATMFKKFTLTPEISFGANYAINDKSYLKVEPTLRALIPMGYMWGTGLNIGYYRRM